MEYHVTTDLLKDIAADWLIVGIPQAEVFDSSLSELDGILGGQLTRLREAGDLTGKPAETLVLPDVPPLAAARVVLAGLGPSNDVDRGALYRAFATAALAISKTSERSVACLVPDLGADGLGEDAAAREIAAALTVGCVGPSCLPCRIRPPPRKFKRQSKPDRSSAKR